jgi:hypothetical protein
MEWGRNNMLNFNKKGAMFGLDARIALAIFGALSVISGAALYSAISQAKVVAFVTELNELGKALESYNIDTGVDLPLATPYGKMSELIVNTSDVYGWNGQYVSSDYTVVDPSYIKKGDVNYSILYAHGYNGTAYETCDGVKACYAWVYVAAIDANFAKQIDRYVDGSDDLADGKVQGYDFSLFAPGKYVIFYRVSLKLKQTL